MARWLQNRCKKCCLPVLSGMEAWSVFLSFLKMMFPNWSTEDTTFNMAANTIIQKIWHQWWNNPSICWFNDQQSTCIKAKLFHTRAYRIYSTAIKPSSSESMLYCIIISFVVKIMSLFNSVETLKLPAVLCESHKSGTFDSITGTPSYRFAR